MADIQENPYGMRESTYGTLNDPTGAQQQQQQQQQQLIVQKTTGHIPHMPNELRHTNYSSNAVGNPMGKKPINPQVMEHQRDSANFSLNSNDSG